MGHCCGIAIYLLLFILFLWPVLSGHEVISPHDNTMELLYGAPVSDRPSNRWFTDFSNAFIPEIQMLHKPDRPRWLALWSNATEMGRPLSHLSGFSKAYPPTHIISAFARSPYRIYGAIAMLAVFLSGLFGYLMMKEQGLHPVACLSGAVMLSMSAGVSYVLTFVMFIWPICWGACILWLISRYLRTRSIGALVGLSFAVYSIIMTAYPQSTVLVIYLALVYMGFELLRLRPARADAIRAVIMFALSALAGAMLSLPAILDLAEAAAASNRVKADDAFFIHIIPKINGLRQAAIYISDLADGFWGAVSHAIDSPRQFNGGTYTPYFIGLAFVSFISIHLIRRLWPLQAFAILCTIATFYAPAYIFAVRHLGFNLSRIRMMSGAFIPLAIMAAYALDAALGGRLERCGRPAAIALFIAPAILIMPWYGSGHDLYAWRVALGFAVFMLLALAIYRRLAWIALALIVVTVMLYGHPLILSRPKSEIVDTSLLVERIRQETNNGHYRYAKYKLVGLPSNIEATLGLKSIHTYNSLSARQYHDFAKSISEQGTTVFGRYFYSLDSTEKLSGPALSYTGVKVIVSSEELPASLGIRKLGEESGVKLYQVSYKPMIEAQITEFTFDADGEVRIEGRLDEQPISAVLRSEDRTDMLSFSLSPHDKSSLLFISQQHHPRWHAKSRSGQELQTVRINGFYQGVIVPAGVDEVTLEFRPLVLYSWIAHLAYGLALAIFTIRWIMRLIGNRMAAPSPALHP